MKIIIIGAEAAGMSAAAKAKRINPDAEIIVYEASDITSFGACGLPYFVAGEFDDPSYMSEIGPEDFAKKGIFVKTHHTVLSVNPDQQIVVVEKDGETFSDHYDRLMIATGGSAIIPPIAGVEKENVFTLKTMADGLTLKALLQGDQFNNITIVGSGFIGLELAEALVHLGKDVRIFERLDRIMPEAFEPEISALIKEELEQYNNIDLHLSESIESITGGNKVTGVSTDKGSYPTDMVILCTGVRPNTAFVREIGLDMLPNGAIRVDDHGRTSLPNIFSAGDCATVWHAQLKRDIYSPLATGANKLGRIIGENIVGVDKAFNGVLNSAAVKVLSIEAGRTGLSEKEAIAEGIPYKTILLNDKNHANYCKGQAQLTIKLIYHADTHAILGAQVFGKNGGAVHRMHALSVGIMTGLTTEDLAFLDFAYAPPFSRVWDALNIAGSIAK